MKKYSFALILILPLFFFACNQDENLVYYKISGFAQGTTYHMTYACKDSLGLQEEVDSILADFDNSLSSYKENSLLCRLNRNETRLVDEKFRKVYEVSRKVYQQSDGAFDITVMPLVNAWGFGPGLKQEIDSGLIDSMLQLVGMEKIKLVEDELIKDNPGTTIDVNAVAQGYSVDIVAEYFESLGIKNYMVEIGGEVRTLGLNPKSGKWKIGVDRPEFGNFMPGSDMQVILEMSGKSLATSGNYRKFYEENGVKYSHSIDPVTGYPVKQDVLSATIISENCIDADAYATACMVMGLEKSRKMIENTNGLEAYLIYGDESGLFQVWYSEGFKQFIFKELHQSQ